MISPTFNLNIKTPFNSDMSSFQKAYLRALHEQRPSSSSLEGTFDILKVNFHSFASGESVEKMHITAIDKRLAHNWNDGVITRITIDLLGRVDSIELYSLPCKNKSQVLIASKTTERDGEVVRIGDGSGGVSMLYTNNELSFKDSNYKKNPFVKEAFALAKAVLMDIPLQRYGFVGDEKAISKKMEEICEEKDFEKKAVSA